MTEENVNLSLSNDESTAETNISFDGNVDIAPSSPLPTSELRESMKEFVDIVSKVVESDMADKDAFVLIRKSWRELRREKLKVYPVNQNKRRNRLKLKHNKKGFIKGIKGKKRKNKKEKK
tara:strand:+ start:107 stop:466 length:360 start_codon:yes stop_codon:yes gene_type:complete